MIKHTTSAAAIALALAAGSAFAADLPSRKEAPIYVAPPVFSWTGIYAGLNLGGGWTDSNNGGWNWSNTSSNAGVVGGLQLGYNYQLSPLFVVGIETDFQGTSIGSHSDSSWGGWGGGGPRLPWFGTVRGRAGIALLDSRLLVYGTGGFAYGEVESRWANWWGSNNVRTGWTAGGGVEWAFLPNWSAKIEYLYTELSNDNWGWSNGRRQTHINTVRAGVNYHFNLFTPAPVVARY